MSAWIERLTGCLLSTNHNPNRHQLACVSNCSVAEQNSVDLAWQVLMEDEFLDLRNCIFTDLNELQRFRALLVNSVIATDIFDKEQGAIRKNRWTKAFDTDRSGAETAEDVNRKATIVIEHLIQASDVAHTMQHWDGRSTFCDSLQGSFRRIHCRF